MSISWRTEATCSPPRRRASHSAGSHLLGSSPREAGDAMGSGTFGVAARQMRVEREGGRGRTWEDGLQGKETTAQAGERAGGRRRIAMGFPLLWSWRSEGVGGGDCWSLGRFSVGFITHTQTQGIPKHNTFAFLHGLGMGIHCYLGWTR